MRSRLIFSHLLKLKNTFAEEVSERAAPSGIDSPSQAGRAKHKAAGFENRAQARIGRGGQSQTREDTSLFHMFETQLDRKSSALPAVKLQTLVALALIANLAIAPAASPAIGVALTGGSFELDAARIHGNGTLFEGSILETGKATSEIKLDNGVHVVLDAGTRSKVYRDHMLLEKGTGQLTAGANYRISARSLQIEGASAKVSASGNRVLVAALAGPVVVKNARGMMVANLAMGRALELEPDSGATNQSVLTGKLEKRNGHYLLTDKNLGLTVEVLGKDLDKYLDCIVEVTGTTEKGAKVYSPATEFIHASNLRYVDNRCNEGAAAIGAGAGAGAGSSQTANSGGGMSNGVKVLIAAGGAGAAITTVALTTGDDKKPISQ